MRNVILISDTHCGCKFGLCLPKFKLDEGGTYESSRFQKEVYRRWLEFHDEWIPEVTKKEDYIIVFNGDCIDGNHHNSTTQITHNIKDQRNLAVQLLTPMVDRKKCKGIYMIRGTEAHVGQSAENEEAVAKSLDAIQDPQGNYSRQELRLIFGKNDQVIHFAHHVGTTSSAAYESTAVYRELVEAYNEAGRWGDKPPSVVCRAHRHRQMEIRIANRYGYGISLCSPAWQISTPFVGRLAMGRSSAPQIGGYLLRDGDEDGIYTRFKVWQVKQTKPERI